LVLLGLREISGGLQLSKAMRKFDSMKNQKSLEIEYSPSSITNNIMMYDPKKAHYLVVTGIIVKNGKFLIAKRSPTEKAFPNQWTVPGGKLEVNDYKERPKDTSAHWYNVFEDVLRREVMEEVGLKVKNIRYLTSLAYIRSDEIPTIIVSLFADCEDDEVKLCSDLTEYAWVTLEEAKSYELIEGIFEELEMLDKVLKGDDVGEWTKK